MARVSLLAVLALLVVLSSAKADPESSFSCLQGPLGRVGTGSQEDIFLADFDADGDLDMALATSHEDKVTVLIGDGLGGYAPGVEYSTPDYPRSITGSDFDGDGDVDIAVACQPTTATIAIFANNGQGVFAPYTALAGKGLGLPPIFRTRS